MKVNLPNTLQFVFVVALVAVLAGMAVTAHDNLVRQGVATGFGFLFDRTGWDVSTSYLPQSPADTYWWTFVVGLSNTVLLALVCIVLATAAGLVFALLSAGQSRILRGLTRLYIGLFRNIPIIVQVFFWYHVTRQLPPVRQAPELLGCCYASNRGIYVPHIGVDAKPWSYVAIVAAIGVGWVACRIFDRWRHDRGRTPLRRRATAATALLVGVATAALAFQFDATAPRLQGFNFVGGTYLSPEFMALVAALVAYNIAFIAEIINSGIRSVPRNQLEAARIIGLSDQRTFWKITLPQAIRVAIPPLINQYISLTKSTSLAIAIGYTDLFSVGVIAINHTGQAINIVALLMIVYVVVSVGLSAIGNIYNRSVMAQATQ